MTAATAGPSPLTVLVYSDDRRVRESVMFSLGRRPVATLPRLDYEHIATPAYLMDRVRQGGVDLLILDGEAAPMGGMGVARQLRDEIFGCPPIVLLVARAADAWLATWSRADAVVAFPVDPAVLAGAVARLLTPRPAVTAEPGAGDTLAEGAPLGGGGHGH